MAKKPEEKKVDETKPEQSDAVTGENLMDDLVWENEKDQQVLELQEQVKAINKTCNQLVSACEVLTSENTKLHNMIIIIQKQVNANKTAIGLITAPVSQNGNSAKTPEGFEFKELATNNKKQALQVQGKTVFK